MVKTYGSPCIVGGSLLLLALMLQETCSFTTSPHGSSRRATFSVSNAVREVPQLRQQTCLPHESSLFAVTPRRHGRNVLSFLQLAAADDDDEDIDFDDDEESDSKASADDKEDEEQDDEDWGEPPDFDTEEESDATVDDEDATVDVETKTKGGKGSKKVKAAVVKQDEDEDDDEDDDIELDVFDEETDDDDDDDDESIAEEVDGKKQKVAASFEDDDEEDEDDEEEEDWEDDEDGVDTSANDDWDEDEDGGDYPLEDDLDDPDYTRQKELVEQAIATTDVAIQEESFDELDFVMGEITPEQADIMDQLPFLKAVEERARGMMLTEEDVAGITDLSEEVDKVSDIMDDPYPRHEAGEPNLLEQDIGVTDNDMQELDDAYKRAKESVEREPWDKVMLKDMTGWEGLSNDTYAEMEDCLEEIGGSAYNVTRWLLYDLDFNVSNLILAAVKHNKDAPVLFQHWYPQLVTYKRYQHARDRNFDFTWNDVENSDSTELERYYAGFGYPEIPKKAPFETGIIGLEYLDEEEIKMAAFETWMTEVYNSEWDRKDFDDDGLRDEDNVFSKYYEAPQHPDLPSFADATSDIEEWNEDVGEDPDTNSYRDMMGQTFEYTIKDEESDRDFRGHLVIACTGEDSDLEIAEKITLRFKQDFGKQVFVETRVLALAREEDNVYEIWLESYDIELLHSKKRATSNAKGWSGPAEVDDAQVDHLAKRVAFLISDDSRYSYSQEMEYVD
jgi:hypothetical protein